MEIRIFSLALKAIALLALLNTAGCKKDFSDSDIRGALTVDKSQYGNDKLEVNDTDSSMTRFIYPGRKILKIDQGIRKTNIFIFESGRAKLARIEIPSNLLLTKEDKSFFVEGRKINQAWNIKAERVLKTIRIDYAGHRGFKTCGIEGSEGVVGRAWEVTDWRHDYIIHFVNEVTGRDIGTFVAIGETKTTTKRVDTKSRCVKKVNIYDTEEAF